MDFVRQQPHAALSHLVECYWHSDGPAAAHARERALPTGGATLAINLRDEPIRRFRGDADVDGTPYADGLIGGVRSTWVLLDTGRPKSVLGVQFRPGGAAALLGVSGADLEGVDLDFHAVWGADGRALRERLRDLRTAQARIDALESALLSRVRAVAPVHPAISFALRGIAAAPTLARVDAVRERTGYGPKRFIAVFREAVGLTPKVFGRIQRFQAVIRRLARGERVEWSQVAADGGFSDQSHLNREFRAFAGVAPGQYRPVAPGRPNHVLDEPAVDAGKKHPRPDGPAGPD